MSKSNRKIIFLINPISGTKDKKSLIETIQKESFEAGIDFAMDETDPTGKYSWLKTRIADENITDIVVCGGDGTINKVVAAIKNVDVNIGIIPMGSGNGLALAAGIPKNYSAALKIIFDGHSAFVDGFTINKQFSCMLCGLGFDAQVAHDFAQQGQRGLTTYIKETFKNFVSASGYEFEITLNAKTILSNAFFISIANSNQFGNHVTIAPKAALNDGLLDIVIVNKMNKLKLLGSMFYQIYFGEVDQKTKIDDTLSGIQYFQTDRLTILNPELAPLHIDGDPVETAAEFRIKAKPNAFKLLQNK